MSHTAPFRRLALTALALVALSAGHARAQAPDALVFAVPKTGEVTAQGGEQSAFAYSEKPGDAAIDKLAVVDGQARLTGTLWPQKGSSWAGIGYITSPGADKTVDASSHKTLRLQLASATAKQLRVRVLGPDKATRDSGCYPIVVLPVTPELRELEIPLSRFAPESYCGGKGRSIADTAKAVAAVEVADTSLAPGTKHMVDFQVGRIELKP